MNEKRCYYEVLGVTRGAGCDDIRRAYRQSALKYHPDRNQGDSQAEARFKEATEAYEVLSDENKRARYDKFGHAGVEGAVGGDPGDIFTNFQDLFSQFFGGFGGGGAGQSPRGPARGRDLRMQQRITLREAMTGCKREVSLRTPATCEECAGSGARPGTKRKSCGTCGGAGQVSTSRGFVMFTQACPECHGEGSVVKTPCQGCKGAGVIEKPRKVVVGFPAGIDTGQRLRVPGQGMPGAQGGPAGDLFVEVEIAQDQRFERDGNDLVTRIAVPFTDAALGCASQVSLPDDTSVDVRIPPGTQPGDVLAVKGKGIPRVDGRGRGSLQVVVEVQVPRVLSSRAEQLLKELRVELDAAAEATTDAAQ